MRILVLVLAAMSVASPTLEAITFKNDISMSKMGQNGAKWDQN